MRQERALRGGVDLSEDYYTAHAWKLCRRPGVHVWRCRINVRDHIARKTWSVQE